MTKTAFPRADVDLLMRSAESLLTAATDEVRLLDVATELLGEQFGYGARYVMLHDDSRAELYLGGAAGELADSPAVREYRARDDAGLAGACWTTRAIVNVRDVGADPRYVAVLPSCRSEICMPIVGDDRVLGVLGVQSSELAAFSSEDERLLAAYARLLALALTHARTHQARRRDIEELKAVSEVAKQAASLDLGSTLSSVCESFRRVTTSDSVAVYLWDATTERLAAEALSFERALYGDDYEREVREQSLALGEGMIGWAALHREPLRIDDVAADGRVLAVKGTPLGEKSAIVIPLVVEDRLVGVARAVKMGVRSYTDDHFRFAQTLASQAALAIAAAEAHEEIRRLSVTDELTGAYNTRYLMQRMRDELEFARRHDDCVSLLVIDGDMMKKVNDRFGHAEGNRLLVEVTAALRGVLRLTDVLARFGGDEFVVLLPRTCANDALLTAERLRVAMSGREFKTSWGEPMRATVSIGLASFPENAKDGEQLFREADRALYAAKQAGRNRVSAAPAPLV
ncbi:MAG TPA: diguanylate cyclase [Candidatus Limnocylindria bacterium]|nr:diguanylate cyclase [Candidatus Limnocylindria bacterium]